MTYKVIVWGLGKVGGECVKTIQALPDFELAGAYVRSDAKAGRDVGDIVGIGSLGVKATQDIDALIAMKADAVCYTMGRDWQRNPEPGLDVMLRILRSGKSVVSTWFPSLVHAEAVSPDIYNRLQAACEEGGSAVYTTGMDPGYGSLGLAMTALNMTRRVDVLHTYEFFDNGNWTAPEAADFFGFGKFDEAETPLLRPGHGIKMHGSTVHLLAKAAGLTLDKLEEWSEVRRAKEDFTVPIAHVPKGGICAVRYQVRGVVDGKVRVILDHVESIRDGDWPEFDFVGDGYRVEVEGDPFVQVDMRISDKPLNKDHRKTHSFSPSVSASMVKAIPAVCAAKPGVVTVMDLPFCNQFGRFTAR